MTRIGTRYGCFLPDLTELARYPSTPISQGRVLPAVRVDIKEKVRLG